MTMHTDVAVIGSGFSAVALSLNLVEVLPVTAKVSLVGTAREQGKGIAYSTKADCHLLNVPAGRMSLFADRPGHFVQWLRENGYRAAGDDFVPRRVYGDYVAGCLDAARRRTANRPALTLVDAQALDAEAMQDGGLLFALSNGERLASRVAVLCTGAGTRRLPLESSPDEAARPFVVHDPWEDAWWKRLPPEADVLFVGTGLTMVDQCLLLKQQGFRGTIHAVSRHGLLPQAHLDQRAEPVASVLVPGEGEVSHMLASLRMQAESVADWRAVMDGLRPVTQALWKAWSPDQRRRFLRHAASFWNVHRHRMAPAAASEIDALRKAGRLVIHRGRLGTLQQADPGVTAVIGGREPKAITAGMVVNCTGFERCTVNASPLLSSLAAQGILRSDPLGLGVAVGDDSAVLPSDGESSGRLYALGPLTAGRHWEITAVPDIRVQARSVAETIGAGIPPG
ncbi:FAD/NAD(P)-binding protein [Shinella sp. BYT-45]|uniref:FAD/NAD(P)-binding protein n=1 Tax=Shinella sp. BYT-45 TaxID=3377377 RepID=UPI0039804B17